MIVCDLCKERNNKIEKIDNYRLVLQSEKEEYEFEDISSMFIHLCQNCKEQLFNNIIKKNDKS